MLEEDICKQRRPWGTPNIINCNSGRRVFGTDYYQKVLLWTMAAAPAGGDLSLPCREDGLTERIMKGVSAE